MDVFVIPVGHDRYELYCETSGEPPGVEPDRPGFIGRLSSRFAAMLHQAEERQRTGTGPVAGAGVAARAQDVILRWVAERVAEQRLLWNLRRESAVALAYPQDLTLDQALAVVRGALRRDYDRHRRWLVIDALLLIVTGALALLPGPNVVAYFFAFRVMGHWLSMRGAAQGLHRVEWIGRPCEPLTALREAVALEGAARDARVRDVAERLRLPHLSTFIDRVAIRHA